MWLLSNWRSCMFMHLFVEVYSRWCWSLINGHNSLSSVVQLAIDGMKDDSESSQVSAGSLSIFSSLDWLPTKLVPESCKDYANSVINRSCNAIGTISLGWTAILTCMGLYYIVHVHLENLINIKKEKENLNYTWVLNNWYTNYMWSIKLSFRLVLRCNHVFLTSNYYFLCVFESF